MKLAGSMGVLGVAIDSKGDTRRSLQHRLTAATKLFWVHKKIFMSPLVSRTEKIQAWTKSVQRSAVFGAGGWHLTKDMLRELLAWERKFLRRRCD